MQYETKDTKEEMEARRRRTAAAAAACASIESPLLGPASAAGMYLGHYIDRITAGLLYAVQLKHDPTVPAWILSLLIRVGLWYYYPGVQAFFLCLPGWLLSGTVTWFATAPFWMKYR